MADLAALVVRMQADNSQYVKALDQATQKLNKFAKDQEDILDGIDEKFSELGKNIAGAFAIEQIVEFSESALEGAAQLEKFSQTAGVSAQTLSAFQIATAGSGISTEELAQSFKKLNVAASEAAGDSTSKAGQAFRLLGIDVHDASGNIKDAATLQDEIADSFSKSADGANKVAIAQTLMGRAGAANIPTLNQGSAALHDAEAAAIAAGAAFSNEAAKAAEEAERSFAQLAATTEGQLKVAIVTNLTPALLGLSQALTGTSSQAEAVSTFGNGIATVLKGVAYVVLEVMGGFEELGNVIGATGAAAVAAAHGNFSQVADIFADLQDQNQRVIARYDAAQAALFKDTADQQIAQAERGAKGAADAATKGGTGDGGKNQLGSPEALAKQDEADKALVKFSQSLQTQAQSFGLGAEAAARYKLSVGELADQLKIAGPAGQAAAKSALAYAHALQQSKDTKTAQDAINSLTEQKDKLDQSDVAAEKYKLSTGELGAALNRLADGGAAARASITALNNAIIDDKDQKAVQALNDKLDEMNGKLVAAAQHSFDLSNKGLTQNLAARGDTSGQATVQRARDAETAQAQYNEVMLQSQKIQADYEQQVAKVHLAQATGAITDIAAQNQLNALQQTEITNQQQIYTQLKGISDDANIPKLTEQTQQFNLQIIDLQKNTNQLENQIRGQLESAFADNFSDLITGAKGFKAAFSDMVKSIQKDLANMVSKDLSQSIFGTGGPAGGAPGLLAGLFGQGGSGGGSSSNGFGFLSGLFGGAGGSSTLGPTASMNADALAGVTDNTSSLLTSLNGFAGGGNMSRGSYAVVGENGPELAYAGSKDMHIQPMSSGGGQGLSVSNTFVLSAPGGTITRQSQGQAAASAARQLSIAARRNG
jgi:hypothetical protein